MAEDPVPQTPCAPPSSSSSNVSPLGNSVIPIVNKLQDIFAQIGGQSSVLESLVDRDFLPRGFRSVANSEPLVLQLLHTQTNVDGSQDEYGEFLHLPGNRFFDFRDIQREIQAFKKQGVIGAGDRLTVENKVRVDAAAANHN